MSDVVPNRIVMLLDISDHFQMFNGEQHHNVFYRYGTLEECLGLIQSIPFHRVDFFIPPTVTITSFHHLPNVYIHPDVDQLPLSMCEDRIRQKIQRCCIELGFDYTVIGTIESNGLNRQMVNQAAQLARDRLRQRRRGRPPEEINRTLSPLPPFE